MRAFSLRSMNSVSSVLQLSKYCADSAARFKEQYPHLGVGIDKQERLVREKIEQLFERVLKDPEGTVPLEECQEILDRIEDIPATASIITRMQVVVN